MSVRVRVLYGRPKQHVGLGPCVDGRKSKENAFYERIRSSARSQSAVTPATDYATQTGESSVCSGQTVALEVEAAELHAAGAAALQAETPIIIHTNMEIPSQMDGLVAVSMEEDSAVADEDQTATSHERLRNASDHAPTSEDPPEDVPSGNAQALLPMVDTSDQDQEIPSDAVEASGAVAAADGVAVDAANGGEMALLVEELTAIRAVLASAVSVDADDDLLQRIRAWSDRIRPTVLLPVDETPHVLATRLIPMTAPSHGFPDTSAQMEWRVVAFDDGVYRGHVQRCSDLPPPSEERDIELESIERFLPHGWGIVTSHQGLRRIGWWEEGEQCGVGSLQSAVFLYDGEWHATKGPSGYGIGTFAFGATFVGLWMSGRPYGLGRLYEAETRSTLEGWMYGTRCLQSVKEPSTNKLHEELVLSHLPLHHPTEQPHRGLFLVGRILEDAHLSSLRRTMNQWRQFACDQVVVLARARRLEAIGAWEEAHTAERQAIAWDMAHQIQLQRERNADMLQEIVAGREKHTRVQRVREFHTNRLETAVFQRDLARRCVLSQAESIALMEAELAQVTVLLEEATQAQAECKAYSHQQQQIKRQIENASVTINALKHQLRLQTDGEDSQRIQREQQDAARRKVKTPSTPAYAKAIHGPRHVKMAKRADEEDELPFVCDVPGCSCGIPRDVFLRVAGAINGE